MTIEEAKKLKYHDIVSVRRPKHLDLFIVQTVHLDRGTVSGLLYDHANFDTPARNPAEVEIELLEWR